ncbi:unnamed protein product [Rhizoctonia solani]|uniref:Uncharacterized protein n=1 Tax=Rhizoctonia solani TaxID=456999 RepID=A0A8H3HI34_9AGAM|nr:unnamed protein product [Rhizoctonia solani]
MSARFPTELLGTVVQYTSKDTQACLSVVSRDVYFISARMLYASISEMGISRATKCLLTLSSNPKLACLVRSFSLNSPFSSRFPQSFCTPLTRALAKMTGLQTLLLVGVFATSSVVSQMPCKLTKLVYNLPCEDSYPISQFLSTQPTIKDLTIDFQLGGISALGLEALPALRRLSAPVPLLFTLLPSQLSRLSQLSILGVKANHSFFCHLVLFFQLSKLPKSLELSIAMDITAYLKTPEVVSLGLALIGLVAPCVSLLRLTTISQGYIGQEELQNMFVFALPWFPNLKTLVIIAPPPAPGAYTRDSPPDYMQPISVAINSLHDLLVSLSRVPVDLSPLLQVEPYQTPNQPNPVPDAIHHKPYHNRILKAWRRAHCGLECVIFPTGTYIYKKEGWEE